MYSQIKYIIDAGNYDLTVVVQQIKILALEGEITNEQREELIEYARSKASPEGSYASLQVQIDTLTKTVEELENRVAALEEASQSPEEGGDEGEGGETEPTEPIDEYPEYKAPTGAHDAYYNGDKVTFNGQHYVCIAPEKTACVWDPNTYPDYWKLVPDDTTENEENGEDKEEV